MNLVLQSWHLMVMYLACWINRQQQSRIKYLQTIGSKFLIGDYF
jgi:hypothetical protein